MQINYKNVVLMSTSIFCSNHHRQVFLAASLVNVEEISDQFNSKSNKSAVTFSRCKDAGKN